MENIVNWPLFAFGCLGAAAPEIIRLYKIKDLKLTIRRPVQYFVCSLLYVLLGGCVAIALDAKSFYAALYIGISLPTLISTTSGKAPALSGQKPAQQEPAPDEVERTASEKPTNSKVSYISSLQEYNGILFSLKN